MMIVLPVMRFLLLKITTFSKYINCFTLNSGHNWEDLCIYLRDQQICTLDNHSQIWGGGGVDPNVAHASL